MTTTTKLAPQGFVNQADLRYPISQTRKNFTRNLSVARFESRDQGPGPDFLTLISLVYEIYRTYGDGLVPIRQFHPSRETEYNQGHTSKVSHAQISRQGALLHSYQKGVMASEGLIVKRPRQSILGDRSDALISFNTELRIHTHPPLREHRNIAKLRRVGWDFEDNTATIPRPPPFRGTYTPRLAR
jgi:hypothetical protein